MTEVISMEHKYLWKVMILAILSTRNPFWKQPKDVYTEVKTRNQIKKSIIASRYYTDFYFDQIHNKNENNTN